MTEASGPRSSQPTQIGTYRILDKLGEGGMGTVYRAEQRGAIRRTAAVKVLKLGIDSKEVLARFAAEQQALAIMEHPSIARVFEAGLTETGQPFLAMEYVPGVPITEFCDKHRLDLKARLALFLQVAEGVQHAHHKGVIHRDIKPSNVLAYEQDGARLAKIIDFGVAKATNQRLTERTMMTELGQILGTPEYMSPEQAEMTALGVDARSDIYSLGVLLYELLVGVLPFDSKELRAAGFVELQRRIREEEPRRPSTRFTTLNGNEAVAQKRRSDRQGWGRMLRGDLDWVILHALEKDPVRRYQSASEFAQDLRRYLEGRPVEARAPSVLYRWSTFVRRHRLPVGLAAALLVSLVAGLAFSIVQFQRAEGEAKVAKQMAADAEKESERSRLLADELGDKKREIEAEFTRSEGSRLLLLGRDLMAGDQGLALALAVAGARLHSSFDSNRILAAMVSALREVAAVDLPIAGASRFSPTPHGMLALGLDGVACHVDLRAGTASVPFPLLTGEHHLARSESTGVADVPWSSEFGALLRQLAAATSVELAPLGDDPLTSWPTLRSIDPEHLLLVAPRQLSVLAKADGRQVAEWRLTKDLRGVDGDTEQVWVLDEDFVIQRWRWRRGLPAEPVVELQPESPGRAIDRDNPLEVLGLVRPFRVFAATGHVVWMDGRNLTWATLSDGRARSITRGEGIAAHADDHGVLIAEQPDRDIRGLLQPTPGCSFRDLQGKRLWRQPLIAPMRVRLGAGVGVLGFTEDRHVRLVTIAEGTQRYLSAEQIVAWRWCDTTSRLWMLSPTGTLTVFDATEGTTSAIAVGQAVQSLLAVSPDGAVLLRGDRRVEVWRERTRIADIQAASGVRLHRIDESILPIDLAPGGPGGLSRHAVTRMAADQLRKAGTVIGSAIKHPGTIRQGAGEIGTLWSPATGERLHAMKGGQRNGLWRIFSADGSRAWIPWSASVPNCAVECDTESGRGLARIGSQRLGMIDTRALLDSFAWLDAPGACVFFDEGRGTELRDAAGATHMLREGGSPVPVATISDDCIVLRTSDGKLRVLGGTPEHTLSMTEDQPFSHACLRPQRVVVAIGNRYVEALDVTTGRSRWRYEHVGIPMVWTAADDGRRFAYATGDGVVVGLDAADGTRVFTSPAGGDRVLSIAFDAPGDRLAYGTAHGLVTVLRWADGAATHEFPHPAPNLPCSVGFAADGSTLVVLALDGTFTFWPLDLLPWVGTLLPKHLTEEERQRYRVTAR